ncbi:MAG: gluconate 2-dehydrogenase subunit 3 family protein [Balneolales bacterium]
MDRREHLKLLLAGSLGAGLVSATSCSEADRAVSEQIIAENTYGRTPEEVAHNQKLQAGVFFTDFERRTVGVLADIIIPADEESPGAVEAGVPDFIEFMMKDIPSMQVPMRGGLMWLNNQSNSRFGSDFVDASSGDQLRLIDDVAYPDTATPEMGYGVRFFNSLRNLVSTGFFTSEPGIAYLGYVGNRANVWDGVPEEVLRKHGFAYDRKILDESVKPADRGRLAEWDENGNLLP